MKSKREWIKLFKNEQVGHAIDAKQAYKSSITEAKDFYEHGIIHEGDTVLDLGSGNGRQAIGLTDYSLKRYVGIEPIKQSVDFSNMAFQDMENYEFIWMDLQNDMYNPNGKIEPVSMKIPFDEDYFDAVIA
jgi:predicted RNA methylase